MDPKAMKYQPADLSGVKTYPVLERPTKVQREGFVSLTEATPSLNAFLDSLPHILKAVELRAVVDAIFQAYSREKPVLVGIGGHVIKCGLSPLLIHLMKHGITSAVATNGVASIHDFEIAMVGRTSEDVAASLESGMFGMARETGEAMNEAIKTDAARGWGMGYAPVLAPC